MKRGARALGLNTASRWRLPRRTALAGCLALLSTAAAAAWKDEIDFFAAETQATDSNIFRISKDLDARTAIGSSERGDTYHITSLGFDLDIPYSLQRFRATVAVNNVRYDRFTYLDFDSRSIQSTWLWQVDNKLSGQLGYNESHALASFENFQNPVANPLDTRQWSGSAAYLLTPRWRAQLEVSELEQRNGAQIRQDNDINVNDVTFTFSRLLPSGGQLGVLLKNETGAFPHPEFVGVAAVDNGYTQRSVGLVGDWVFDEQSHLNATVDEIRRRYNQLGGRDFSGATYVATYDWKPTGRFTLTAVAQRDISPFQDIQTSFVLVKGISLRSTYEVGAKTMLSGSYGYSIVDYLGDPEIALGATNSPADRLRSASIALTYMPLRKLSVALSAQRESRSSNIPLNDYLSTVVSITVKLAY